MHGAKCECSSFLSFRYMTSQNVPLKKRTNHHNWIFSLIMGLSSEKHESLNPEQLQKVPLTLFGPSFFPTLKDCGDKMAHRHISCISSQKNLKFGIDIIWVMFTSN